MFKSVKVMDLRTGDVLASGFVVSNNTWRGVRTPKNKVNVEGRYPGQTKYSLVYWNRNTVVQVRV